MTERRDTQQLLTWAEPTGCACCGRPVPRNRTWLANVCTPSCWQGLKPAERDRLVDEPTPCLVCQGRIGERVRRRRGGVPLEAGAAGASE